MVQGSRAPCNGASVVPDQQLLEGTGSNCCARVALECCNSGNPIGPRRYRGDGVLQNRFGIRAAPKHRLRQRLHAGCSLGVAVAARLP